MMSFKNLIKNDKTEEEYKKYIQEHISNVLKIYESVKTEINKNLNNEKSLQLNINIYSHDKSKYSEYEFYGYKQYFYPNDKEVKNQDMFDLAWNHHQKTNKHHWEYWVLIKSDGNVILPMDYIYIIEMLCDWSAMSLKFGNLPSKFYNKNKNKMLLHGETEYYIEGLLNLFDNAVENLKGN